MHTLGTKQYMKGTVAGIGKTYIIFESNYTGYIIYTAKPNGFEMNKEYKMYIYSHKTKYVEATYGFKTPEELDTFLDLLKIKGIGVTKAINKMSLLNND